MNRSKKAILNMASQLILQFVTAVCGFIIPKLILESFGSELNGVVTSISQFLGIMALLESGFGGVAKSAFFKPLAKNDRTGISGVYNATESFFRKVAVIFLIYAVALSFVFPFFQESNFGYWFILILVLILGVNSFMQYYFGISYTLLYNADQRGYFATFLQIITVIFNALLTVLLLRWGANIHVVKLVSAGVFIIKPMVVNFCGRRRYRVDRKIAPDTKSVAQKWDNLGQSVAQYVHTKTSYIFITFFLTFVDVSVYSVYSLITTSLSAMILGISTGFVSGLGNMYAGGEKENFQKVFSLYAFVNTLVTFAFYTVALATMIPFVSVYTANITDVDYIRPVFGTVLIISELVYCIRLPYYYMITNAGHFKQIKKGAYVEAGINIALSLILVHFLGLTGLALATSVAMTYRTVEIVLYCSKNITKQSPLIALKRLIVNAVGALIVLLICHFIPFTATTFIQWILLAIIVAVVAIIVLGLMNLIFFKKDFGLLFQKFKSVLRR